MSRENVEIVRGIFEAWIRRDNEASLRDIAEDVEFIGPPDFSGAGRSFRGHAGLREGLAEWVGAWDDYRFEVRNLIDAGEEIVVEAWQRGRGKGSGAEVSEAIYSVWTVREGKAVRQRLFRDKEEALEAAGLLE